MNETDVVIIGAGHNGLTCAAYLAHGRPARDRGRAAQGGRRRRRDRGIPSRLPQFGGGLHRQPAQSQGDRRSQAGRARPQIVERRAQNFLPSPDGKYLLTGEGRTHASVARLSAHDADAIEHFRASWKRLPTCCAASCCARRRIWSKASASARSSESFNALGTADILRGLSLESNAICSTCSRARPARCWTSASSTIW